MDVRTSDDIFLSEEFGGGSWSDQDEDAVQARISNNELQELKLPEP